MQILSRWAIEIKDNDEMYNPMRPFVAFLCWTYVSFLLLLVGKSLSIRITKIARRSPDPKFYNVMRIMFCVDNVDDV